MTMASQLLEQGAFELAMAEYVNDPAVDDTAWRARIREVGEYFLNLPVPPCDHVFITTVSGSSTGYQRFCAHCGVHDT